MLEKGGKKAMKTPDWMKGSDACFLPFPEHFNTVTGPASRTSMEMLPLREIEQLKKSLLLHSVVQVIFVAQQQVRQWFESCFHGKYTAVFWLSNSLWTLNSETKAVLCYCDNYNYVWAEQWQKEDKYVNYHISELGWFLKYLQRQSSLWSQHKIIRFQAFTQGHNDTDGRYHNWNVCQCQGSNQ